MSRGFERVLYAGWRDMDYNSHMANTAYLDRSADVRMMYFAENGFTADDMLRMRIGPVVMKLRPAFKPSSQLFTSNSGPSST